MGLFSGFKKIAKAFTGNKIVQAVTGASLKDKISDTISDVLHPKMPKAPKIEKAVDLEAEAQAASAKSKRERDANATFKGLVGARAFLGGSGFGGYLK